MDYAQTLDYLYAKLPMFTRVGAVAYKNDLHNTVAMCEKLGNPQDKFKSIHIGGTNGKGSTSHMLAAVFQQAGYKTGLYTSPHLKDFRERIRINGEMVPQDFVIDFVAQQAETIEELSPSFFEVTVAMAFSYFAQEQVDIAIIEVGLGGRLDSTNIISPLLSIITNISLDHTNLLGNTIAEIAGEKAGIIKPGTPVVIGERQTQSDQVFINKALETGSPIYFADEQLKLHEVRKAHDLLTLSVADSEGHNLYNDLRLDLTGFYQLKNVLAVIQSLQVLKDSDYTITEASLYAALKQVKALTGLQGRWQTLGTSPLIVCDTGHNIAGIEEVMRNISDTPYQQLHMVIGMVKDKDISGVLQLLPADATYYFCQPNLERALPATELAELAAQYQLKGKSFSSVSDALDFAKTQANADDLIFVGGSTFVVAEVL
ncbi:MAG: folylpolyglutamate synthase/dihydrofolate synthase family protein [Bacteroidota bacterium]